MTVPYLRQDLKLSEGPKKEDGSSLLKGDKAEFKVIEFNKEFKRVVLSHTLTHKNDTSTDNPDEKNLKENEPESKDD